jgi:hypothetical protein
MADETQAGTFDLNANPAENLNKSEAQATNPLNTGNGTAAMPAPAPVVEAPAQMTVAQAPAAEVPATPVQMPMATAPINATPNIDLDKELESQLAEIEQAPPKEKKIFNVKNLILLGISILAIGISVFIIFKILGASRSEQANMNNTPATNEAIQEETTPPPGVDNPFQEETATDATTDTSTDTPSDAMLELEETVDTLEENLAPPGLTIPQEEPPIEEEPVKRAR